MKSLKLIAFSVLVIALVALLALQRRELSRLDNEVEATRRSVAEAANLRAEHDRLAASAASGETLAVLREENEELKRLETELTALKQRPTPGSTRPPPKPLPPGMTSLGELKNVGAATPAEALQTFFWTVAEADPAEMAKLLGYVGDARSRAEQLFATLDPETRKQIGSPDQIIALFMQALFSRVSGFQLLNQSFPAQDYAAWNLRLQTMSGKQREYPFALHNEGGSWRVIVTPQMVDMTRAYLGTRDLLGH